MPVSVTRDDLLPHIQYQDAQSSQQATAGQARNLSETVASPSGRIVIVSAFGCSLVLVWQFGSAVLQVSIILETPLGTVTLGSATIDTSNPTITIGGSAFGFKAEATIGFDFGTLVLSFNASVCAPLLGCKNASGSIHL